MMIDISDDVINRIAKGILTDSLLFRDSVTRALVKTLTSPDTSTGCQLRHTVRQMVVETVEATKATSQGFQAVPREEPQQATAPPDPYTIHVGAKIRPEEMKKLAERCERYKITEGEAIRQALNIIFNYKYDINTDSYVAKGRGWQSPMKHDGTALQVRSHRLASEARAAGLEVKDHGRITIPPRTTMLLANVGVDPVVIDQVE